MQSTTESIWNISDANFGKAKYGEMIFGQTINQTLIVSKESDEHATVLPILWGYVVGYVQYPEGFQLDRLPTEVVEGLTGMRRARNAPIAPSRELTPAWVRGLDEEAIKAVGGTIHFYSEEFAKHTRVAFISGNTRLCQFSYHLRMLGYETVETWKPEELVSFSEQDMRIGINAKIFVKDVEAFRAQHAMFRTKLAAMECGGFLPYVKTKSGKEIKFSELELMFRVGDPHKHLGAILPDEFLTKPEKRRMTSLVNLINDSHREELATMERVVDFEVSLWKPQWMDALRWFGDHSPTGGSIDKGDLPQDHQIIHSFIDAGLLQAVDVGERIQVTFTGAGVLVLAAVLKFQQQDPNVGDGVI